ncbi:MAG: hypothetical protein LBU73_08570 [Helicobacteraceae bacterium]|jgi:hypothetical protein|nr:hypothetical protein [Helicobacteraceae bacterium]
MKLALFLSSAAAVFAFENSVFINLNSNDLEGGYEAISQITKNTSGFFGVRAMQGDDKYDNMQTNASAHFKAVGLTPLEGVAVGLGVKAFGVWLNKEDKVLFAAPLGAAVIYSFPFAIQTSISLSYDFAPTALCFKNCARYTEARAEFSIEPIDGGMIFVGWRDMDFKIKYDGVVLKEKYELNRSFYGGLRLSF